MYREKKLNCLYVQPIYLWEIVGKPSQSDIEFQNKSTPFGKKNKLMPFVLN